MRLGYHASHEQFSPRELLHYAQLAEAAGFNGVMSSEHIAPWSVRQGNSGFTWAWLGAAMQATQHVNFGALAIPGGWRYHPVVAAHAFATLAQMSPKRLPWIAAGSGEAMNEHVVGQKWPSKAERNERLREAVDIMRALWRGETVDKAAGPLKTHQAKLWSLPGTPPAIYAAALSVETASWAGEWADGLITVVQPVPELQKRLDGFCRNGGAGKPIILQMQLSWAETKDQARANAHDQWRHIAIDVDRDDVTTPEKFDAACQQVRPEQMDEKIFVSADATEIIAYVEKYASLGFDEIYLHNAGRNQPQFIEFFHQHILPFFKDRS